MKKPGKTCDDWLFQRSQAIRIACSSPKRRRSSTLAMSNGRTGTASPVTVPMPPTTYLALFLTNGLGIDKVPDDPEPTVTPPTLIVNADNPPYDSPPDQLGGITPPKEPNSDDDDNANTQGTTGVITGTGHSKQGGNIMAGGNIMTGTSKPLQRKLQKLLTDATGTVVTAGKTRSQSKAAIEDEDEAPNDKTTGPLEVHYIYNMSLVSNPGKPCMYKQAMNGPNCHQV